MYSGLVLTRFSGRIIGAHQQIDRIARRHLSELLPQKFVFPGIRSILNFEGKNGPDGIKIKSPAKNEPWHYFDPLSGDNKAFIKLLQVHYDGLVKELKAKNHERSAFEAAWLAHAVVDGLTPAHHYPFTEQIAKLRGGKSNLSRTSYRKKLIFSGETKRETVRNMIKAYGPRGLYIAHWIFEFGFSAIIRPLRFPDARPTKRDVERIAKLGYQAYFLEAAATVASAHMFEAYLKDGWNGRLAREIREDLAPRLIRTVTAIWYSAAREAEA